MGQQRARTGEATGIPERAPGPAEAGRVVAPVRLTHPDRLYWPDAGVTKQRLADYYGALWPHIAPHILGRPLALLRCPTGIAGERFFQKHAWKGMHRAIRRIPDPADPSGEPLVGIDTLEGLIGLVQGAALEIHPWGATTGNLERPDRIIMDLDPGEGVAWPAIMAAAEEVRQRLQAAGLAAFLKTSGGKGLHVVAPLLPQAEWPAVRGFTKVLAQRMAADAPDRFIATIGKAQRKGRILIDYLRNQRGATAVAPYSPRAWPGGTVSAPLAWEELAPGLSPAQFTVASMPRRMAHGPDAWAGFEAARRPLPTPR